MAKETIGVILLNMGGPSTLEEVEPFLFNLFSDRDIIRLGPFAFLQKFIARKIARGRAPKSRESYRLIGGGSPLPRITKEQGAELAAALAEQGDFRVTMAMRYWHPFATETLAEFKRDGITRIVAITLYPHYSVATTGSSLKDLRTATEAVAPAMTIVEIDAWPDQPDYIACLAGTIRDGLAHFAGQQAEVVYSAHSLPVKFIEEGDPYLEHINKTIAAVEQETGIKGHLCFQSRSGPVEWLSPSTPEMLEKLAKEGCKNILMVPVSFVSDHVETLYEVDMLYKDMAKELGMELVRTQSLNTNPLFIKALKELVLEASRKKGFLG